MNTAQDDTPRPTILFIALVHTGHSRFEATKYGLKRTFELLSHKHSILNLVAWLRENGCEGHYVWADPAIEEGLPKFEKAIAEINPDAIGMSLCTDEMMSHYGIIEHLKEKHPNLPIIVGGPHPSPQPEHTLEHFPLIDYIAIGDGERTLEEWLVKVARGQGKSDMRDIKGLAFRDESDEIVLTPPRERFDDINILPEPAFDLIIDPVNPPDLLTVFPIFCSYGCRFFCTFCAADHGVYRYLEPARVVDRIERAQKQYGVEYFSILDGLWPPSRAWVEEFCDEIEKRGLKIKLQFATRAEALTEKHFERLKRLGAQAVVIGVEAGDPTILRKIKKGITPDLVRKAYSALNKVGIFSAANFMFGNQEENRDTIQASIDLAHELNPSIALFRAHCPLPGTEVFKLVPDEEKEYWMVGGVEKDWWMEIKFPSVCDLAPDELMQLARDAYLRYPLRWAYLRQHVLSGKLSPEYRAITRRMYLVHLKKYVLGVSERFWLIRKLTHGAKSIARRLRHSTS